MNFVLQGALEWDVPFLIWGEGRVRGEQGL